MMTTGRRKEKSLVTSKKCLIILRGPEQEHCCFGQIDPAAANGDVHKVSPFEHVASYCMKLEL